MSTSTSFIVSVIIPVYNAEKYVARAVCSALMQPEVGEVILVEDASPDKALDVCIQLQATHPGKIRLLQHPDGGNHGAGPSRNLGIKAARHPFIAFLDADDYYLPGRFQRDADLLMADDSLDGVYNALGVDFIDEAGKQWWQAGPKRPLLTTLWDPPPPETLFLEMSLIGNRGLFSFDTATFRKEVFTKAGLFSDLRLAQDSLLRMQIAARCRLAGGQTREPVAMRGVHGQNRIQHPDRMSQAEKEVFTALIDWAAAIDLPRRQRTALHHACIRRGQSWTDLRKAIARYPRVLLHIRTTLIVVRWMIFRRSADEPYLPGILPGLRRRIAHWHRARGTAHR